MRAVALMAIGLAMTAVFGCALLPARKGDHEISSSGKSDSEGSGPFRLSKKTKPDAGTGTKDPSKTASDPVVATADDLKQLQEEIGHLPPERQRKILADWKTIDASMRQHFLSLLRSDRLLRTADSDERPWSRDDSRSIRPDDRNGDPAFAARSSHRREVSPVGHSDPAHKPDAYSGPVILPGPPFGNPKPPGRQFRSDIAGSRDDNRRPADDRSHSRTHGEPPRNDPPLPSPKDNPSSYGPFGRITNGRSLIPLPSFTNPFRGAGSKPELSSSNSTSDGRVSTLSVEPFSSEWNRTLQQLVKLTEAETEKQAPSNPNKELSYLRGQVYRRFLYLLSGRTSQAVAAIPGIDAADQEFWQKTMWGLSAYFDAAGDSDHRSRATQTITRLDEAIEHLRAEADLVVKSVVFCKLINSFGNYEKVAKTDFRPGEQVLIYAEFENFKTELTPEGHHRTRLKSEIELFQKVNGEYHESKRKFDFQPTEDVCRSYRRDYFHSYILTLPQSLALGDYVLKLTVTDQVGNKISTDTVQFTVK